MWYQALIQPAEQVRARRQGGATLLFASATNHRNGSWLMRTKLVIK
jgi:hypothetical protein